MPDVATQGEKSGHEILPVNKSSPSVSVHDTEILTGVQDFVGPKNH